MPLSTTPPRGRSLLVRAALGAVVGLSLASCDPLGTSRFRCDTVEDCAAGYECREGVCALPCPGGDGCVAQVLADGGVGDAGDAGMTDAGMPDGGRPDAAATRDAGAHDGGPPRDGGQADAADAAMPACVDPDGDGRGAGCALGPDCSEGDNSLHTWREGWRDADGDGVVVDPPVMLCTDGQLPDGWLSAADGARDCAPDDNARYRLVTGHPDADLDGYTDGTTRQTCTGDSLPAGLLASASATVDCDDTDGTRHTWVDAWRDSDEDTFTVGDALPVCAGEALPEGWQPQPSSPLDCNDNDATWGAEGQVFRDEDADGYTTAQSLAVCGQAPGGWAPASTTLDNCPQVSNPQQQDLDSDGAGDACDGDDDGDTLSDGEEVSGARGWVTDPLSADSDGDGVDDAGDEVPTRKECTTLLFRDTFEGPSNQWTPTVGMWARTQGTYATNVTSNSAQTWIGSQAWTDYVVFVRLRPDGNANDPGVMFRATSVNANANGGAYWYAALRPGTDQVILGFMNGSWNQVAQAAFNSSAGTFYELRITATGSSLTVAVDGTVLITHSDGRYPNGGVGFRSWQCPATYDDLVVCR